MTNEQKAKEISDNISYERDRQSVAYRAAMRMAEWKDEQYKQERQELLGLVNMLHINENNQSIIEDLKMMLL